MVLIVVVVVLVHQELGGLTVVEVVVVHQSVGLLVVVVVGGYVTGGGGFTKSSLSHLALSGQSQTLLSGFQCKPPTQYCFWYSPSIHLQK